MKTTTIIFLSYLTILGTFLPCIVQGQGLSSSKQAQQPEQEQPQPTEQAQAPSPAFIYPNPVIPLSKNNQGAAGDDAEGIKKMPQLSEEQKKCMVSFVNKGMSTCLEDIGNSYVTEKITVRPNCCTALDALDNACRLAIHFSNKDFEGHVTKYCGVNGAGAGAGSSPSESPAPEAEGPVSDGGFGDGAYPDMTGQLGERFGSAFGPGPAEGPGPYGSYEGYGPSEGPSAYGDFEGEVGPMIEGSSPISGDESSTSSVEGSSPSLGGAASPSSNEGSSPISADGASTGVADGASTGVVDDSSASSGDGSSPNAA